MNRFDQAPSSIQSLIFDKEKYPNRADVSRWLQEHGFKIGGIEETENSFRARQRPPGQFQEGRFRIIDIRPGIRAVIGRRSV